MNKLIFVAISFITMLAGTTSVCFAEGGHQVDGENSVWNPTLRAWKPAIVFKKIPGTYGQDSDYSIDMSSFHPYATKVFEGRYCKNYEKANKLNNRNRVSKKTRRFFKLFGKSLMKTGNKIYIMGWGNDPCFYPRGVLPFDKFVQDYANNARMIAGRLKKLLSALHNVEAQNQKITQIDNMYEETERLVSHVKRELDFEAELTKNIKNIITSPFGLRNSTAAYEALHHLFNSNYPVDFGIKGLMSQSEIKRFDDSVTLSELHEYRNVLNYHIIAIKRILRKNFELERIEELDAEAQYYAKCDSGCPWADLRDEIEILWLKHGYDKSSKSRYLKSINNQIRLDREYNLP